MFTVNYLKSLQTKDKPFRVYEKAARKGFGIQVSPKGTKTFFYGYKTKENKQRFIKLGVFGDEQGKVTLKEAGIIWEKWYKIRQAGSDPQIVRDSRIREKEETHKKAELEKQELGKQGTYEQLLNAYVDDFKK